MGDEDNLKNKAYEYRKNIYVSFITCSSVMR